MIEISPHICAVPGFLASATHAGLKKNDKLDLALIVAPLKAQAGAVFTQSQTVAAPVTVSRQHLRSAAFSSFIINAGNANACTGLKGIDDSIATCRFVGRELDCSPRSVLIASTGVIGVALPLAKIQDAIPVLVDSLSSKTESLGHVSAAIMTTDLTQKQCSTKISLEGNEYTVAGFAKGSGMIAPNMATMIGCILTDAPLDNDTCQMLIARASDQSFNCVTVDGDTSTNDTCVLMASGLGLYPDRIPIDSGHAQFHLIETAVLSIAQHLARAIAADGEGATKLITVTVEGTRTDEEAKQIALTIANSPLVKTAAFGNDANWGRVAAAVGRSGIAFDQGLLDITFAGIKVCHKGCAVPFNEEDAFAALDNTEVEIEVTVGSGEGSARIWSCDLSYDYIRINGEYRS